MKMVGLYHLMPPSVLRISLHCLFGFGGLKKISHYGFMFPSVNAKLPQNKYKTTEQWY